MRDSSSAESPPQAGDSVTTDPAAVNEQAKSLLASMTRFLAEADRLSVRIRVAVTVPVGLMCVLGWALLTGFGPMFQGQARHPEVMLAAGIVLLLIGLHGATRRTTSELPVAFLAAVVALIYVTAVLMNGLLPTLFLGAVIIALHTVAPARVALALSMAALIATPALVWSSSSVEPNLPHLFRVVVTGLMAITFLQLLCRANARFKAEAIRVARGLQALMSPLGESLSQALLERRRAEIALSEVQAAEAQVATIKAQLEDAVGSMSQGLVMVDAHGHVLLCNPQARRMLDLPPGLLGASKLSALVLDCAADLVRGEPEGLSRRTLNEPEGRHVEVSSQRMRSGHTVHTCTDVTEYVHANEQLRSTMLSLTRAKEQLNVELLDTRRNSDMQLKFVASVSHEIRTPLNGIVGMVDLLARSGLDARQTELLDDVKTSTRQLRQLTDDVLDLSSLKDAHFSLALAPIDLGAFMTKIVRAAQGAAQVAGLRLELLMREAPCLVVGDAQRLQQILNNLIYNAIKFTGSGAVRVHVDWRTSVGSSTTEVIISVADTGRGIAAAALNKIFEPFQQADDSINRDFGGTGLGLALCRELCEAMDGTIRVSSRLGHGSVFTVMVQLEQADHGADFEDTHPAELGDSSWGLAGKRILVVDDNRINQKLLSIWLHEAGASVCIAGDGAEGLRMASTERLDAILMDVSMPVMNGLEATRAIRLLAQSGHAQLMNLAALPIIGVTAMARSEDLAQCLDCGMDAHLSKPLERVKLLRTLADVIETRAWLSGVKVGKGSKP